VLLRANIEKEKSFLAFVVLYTLVGFAATKLNGVVTFNLSHVLKSANNNLLINKYNFALLTSRSVMRSLS
jgi:hypothetical protein